MLKLDDSVSSLCVDKFTKIIDIQNIDCIHLSFDGCTNESTDDYDAIIYALYKNNEVLWLNEQYLMWQIDSLDCSDENPINWKASTIIQDTLDSQKDVDMFIEAMNKYYSIDVTGDTWKHI